MKRNIWLATSCHFGYKAAWIHSSSTNYSEFQFRLLNKCLVTNVFLNNIGVSPSPACSLCGKENESLEHILISCNYTREFWAEVIKWLCNLKVNINNPNNREILFGMSNCEDKIFVNHVLLIKMCFFLSLTKFKRIGQRFLTLLKDVSAEDLQPSSVLKKTTACNGYIVRAWMSYSNTRDIAKMHVRWARETFDVTLAIYKCWECLYVHFLRSGPLENAMPQGRASYGTLSPCPQWLPGCNPCCGCICSCVASLFSCCHNITHVAVRHSRTHYVTVTSHWRFQNRARPKILAETSFKRVKKRCQIRLNLVSDKKHFYYYLLACTTNR